MNGRRCVTAALLMLATTACETQTEARKHVIGGWPDSVVIARGGAAASRLAGGLLAPLTAALEQHGTEGAVEFCSQQAEQLTTAIQDSIGDGIELKRVTLRARNPRNAPDSVDLEVLQQLHQQAEHGDTLPEYIIREADNRARYYRPLVVQPLCLQCHGNVMDLDPAVRATLVQHYPRDQATGYRVGDLRGVIRVSFPPPAGR